MPHSVGRTALFEASGWHNPDDFVSEVRRVRASNGAEEVAQLVKRYERFECSRGGNRKAGTSQVAANRHPFGIKVGDCRGNGHLTDKRDRFHGAFPDMRVQIPPGCRALPAILVNMARNDNLKVRLA